MQHGPISQQVYNNTVIAPRHHCSRLLRPAVRKPSLILCLSHAKGLMLAALLLTLMLWPGQDIAVLQAVLLGCCIHCVILWVRILKLQLPVGNVPAGEKQQVPSRHSSFTLPVCEHHHGLHKHCLLPLLPARSCLSRGSHSSRAQYLETAGEYESK